MFTNVFLIISEKEEGGGGEEEEVGGRRGICIFVASIFVFLHLLIYQPYLCAVVVAAAGIVVFIQ